MTERITVNRDEYKELLDKHEGEPLKQRPFADLKDLIWEAKKERLAR